MIAGMLWRTWTLRAPASPGRSQQRLPSLQWPHKSERWKGGGGRAPASAARARPCVILTIPVTGSGRQPTRQ
eukprot:7991290-Alexandrium_andersonii.AAC.1